MNRSLIASIPAATFLLACLASGTASAQVPFFGAGVGIFDPEIGVVQSGVVLDAQAVVSADRKYVTLNMRAQQAQLLSLQEFAFQRGNAGAGGVAQGFVGGVGAGSGAADEADEAGRSAGGRASNNRSTASPRRPSILDRPGMTLLGRAPDSPPGRRT